MQRLQPHVIAKQRAKLAVGFADLVGFTEMSRRLSEGGLASLMSRFESGASDLVVGLGGRVIKSLGDEILFVADAPVAAATIALALVASARGETGVGIPVGLEYVRLSLTPVMTSAIR